MASSFFRLCLQHASRLYVPARSSAIRRRTHFLLRCLLSWRSTSRWFHFIEATEPLRHYIANHAFITDKPFRKYMRRNWRRRDRLKCILDHYRLMLSCDAGLRVLQLCATEDPIAIFHGRSGMQYDLVLTACRANMKEGEVLIELRRDLRRICCVSGSFCQRNGQRVFVIGTMQGAGGQDARDFTREVTKDLNQFRPRDLAMEAAQTLASVFGASAIFAPSQKQHILAGRHNPGDVKADFDSLWIDLGGQMRDDGEFALPLRTYFKQVEEIPSKKRAETLRRYALKRQIADDIRKAIGSPVTTRGVRAGDEIRFAATA